MKKNILITGCSSGLGLALTNYYLDKEYIVYGISRTKPNIEDKNFIFKKYDLSKIELINQELTAFLSQVKEFEVVYLNAGMLGGIKILKDLSCDEIKEVLDLNVFANKELLDILSPMQINTIIGISSGASVKGSKGWGAYSLSKASLNMLLSLYSKEMLDTKILAVAPGVIETPMTDVIRFDVDDNIFTSAKVLKEGEIQQPLDAAARLDEVVKRADEFESGSFIDVRNI
ncbi:SDR family NAD(P)-dependent oxidoreductase [Arcobacter arenosus]|jgi:alcohol dehydrogenase/benzil reductase ((S)-benzoin forming)|uniref:SDR family NAD(P)-dependent oxidoreductase n=1 Tax=Arcobacter arenosus TaxID=2576037 RepID=A0A5R8XZT0_9BACT|nr:SDR family NAD(P)-dependent oxidoreductase [Arcobacter arenosus]TLP37558.1 SDR family NAD(P)-dependent oxidoreductase [Arcobacter arenosus]